MFILFPFSVMFLTIEKNKTKCVFLALSVHSIKTYLNWTKEIWFVYLKEVILNFFPSETSQTKITISFFPAPG